MTWTKLSDSFGDECAPLSDAAFRTHTEALIWAMRRENGGLISKKDLRRFAETDDPECAVAELVGRGVWTAISVDSWLIQHHMQHQPEPDVIVARRAKEAIRQQKRRRKLAGLDEDESRKESRKESRRDIGRDNTRDPERNGTERVGKERTTKAAPTDEVPRPVKACAECGKPNPITLRECRGVLVCPKCKEKLMAAA